MATILNPALWMRARISPCSPPPTASGLIIANVRSRAKTISSKRVMNGRRHSSRLQRCGNRRAQVGGSLDAANTRRAHRRVFVFGGALPAADDRARMAHAAAWRRGLPRDKSNHRLSHMRLDELGGALFRVPANFANQNNRARLRVVIEHLNGIQKRRADDRIAANPNARGLADSQAR